MLSLLAARARASPEKAEDKVGVGGGSGGELLAPFSTKKRRLWRKMKEAFSVGQKLSNGA